MPIRQSYPYQLITTRKSDVEKRVERQQRYVDPSIFEFEHLSDKKEVLRYSQHLFLIEKEK